MALITQNIDHHGRTRNLYPWTNLDVPLIRSPKNKINSNLILMHFRLHLILTTRCHYLYIIDPHHPHLRRSAIIRLRRRRLCLWFPTGTRPWTIGNRTTTTMGRGAASVLLCDLFGTYRCVFSLGRKIFELRFSWPFLNAFDMNLLPSWSHSFFKYPSILLSRFLYILTSPALYFWRSSMRIIRLSAPRI